MSHIPQNIVATNHLFCDLWTSSGLSALQYTFPSSENVHFFPTLPHFSPFYLGIFWFSCISLARLTFSSLLTRGNAEITFLWNAVAGVCQERGGCWKGQWSPWGGPTTTPQSPAWLLAGSHPSQMTFSMGQS